MSGIGVVDDEGRAVLGASTIWKALSFQCRLDLNPRGPGQLSDEDKSIFHKRADAFRWLHPVYLHEIHVPFEHMLSYPPSGLDIFG